MTPAILQSNIKAINGLCEHYSVIGLDAFGSVLRKDFTEESDIDFLVRFRRDGKIDAFRQYFEFKEGLETLLNRKVDLVCENALRNSYLKRELKETREPLYAA
jgi:predicted nucleotidyltransferase